MKKFGLDIMTGNMKDGDTIGRILLPMSGGKPGWHDIMYLDPDEISQIEENLGYPAATDNAGRMGEHPEYGRTTARLAWDERGSMKKGTAHIRLDVTLPEDADSWDADVAIGMNPEGQPVCRVALPDNGLCEIWLHGKLVTIRSEGREAADWKACHAEFRGRMIHAAISGNALELHVTDEHRPRRRACPPKAGAQGMPKPRRRHRAGRKHKKSGGTAAA